MSENNIDLQVSSFELEEDSLDIEKLRSDVHEVFAENGIFSRKLKNYSPRKGQIELADTVAQGLGEDSRILMVEAGTGTGKTFSYLVPPILAGKRVIVSTGTKALQDQLVDKDIPNLLNILDRKNLMFMGLKGHSNYICRYMYDELNRDVFGSTDFGRVTSYVEDTIEEFENYRQSYNKCVAPNFAEMRVKLAEDKRSRLVCDSLTCKRMRKECSYVGANKDRDEDTCNIKDNCFITTARSFAQKCDVIVINHALFFASLGVSRPIFSEQANPDNTAASKVQDASLQANTQANTANQANVNAQGASKDISTPQEHSNLAQDSTLQDNEELSTTEHAEHTDQSKLVLDELTSLVDSPENERGSLSERVINMLPKPDVLVFDEAHTLPEVGRSFYTRRLDREQILNYRKDLLDVLKDITGFHDYDEAEKFLEDIRLGMNDLDRTFSSLPVGQYNILNFKYVHADGSTYVKVQKHLMDLDLLGNVDNSKDQANAKQSVDSTKVGVQTNLQAGSAQTNLQDSAMQDKSEHESNYQQSKASVNAKEHQAKYAQGKGEHKKFGNKSYKGGKQHTWSKHQDSTTNLHEILVVERAAIELETIPMRMVEHSNQQHGQVIEGIKEVRSESCDYSPKWEQSKPKQRFSVLKQASNTNQGAINQGAGQSSFFGQGNALGQGSALGQGNALGQNSEQVQGYAQIPQGHMSSSNQGAVYGGGAGYGQVQGQAQGVNQGSLNSRFSILGQGQRNMQSAQNQGYVQGIHSNQATNQGAVYGGAGYGQAQGQAQAQSVNQASFNSGFGAQGQGQGYMQDSQSQGYMQNGQNQGYMQDHGYAQSAQGNIQGANQGVGFAHSQALYPWQSTMPNNGQAMSPSFNPSGQTMGQGMASGTSFGGQACLGIEQAPFVYPNHTQQGFNQAPASYMPEQQNGQHYMPHGNPAYAPNFGQMPLCNNMPMGGEPQFNAASMSQDNASQVAQMPFNGQQGATQSFAGNFGNSPLFNGNTKSSTAQAPQSTNSRFGVLPASKFQVHSNEESSLFGQTQQGHNLGQAKQAQSQQAQMASNLGQAPQGNSLFASNQSAPNFAPALNHNFAYQQPTDIATPSNGMTQATQSNEQHAFEGNTTHQESNSDLNQTAQTFNFKEYIKSHMIPYQGSHDTHHTSEDLATQSALAQSTSPSAKKLDQWGNKLDEIERLGQHSEHGKYVNYQLLKEQHAQAQGLNGQAQAGNVQTQVGNGQAQGAGAPYYTGNNNAYHANPSQHSLEAPLMQEQHNEQWSGADSFVKSSQQGVRASQSTAARSNRRAYVNKDFVQGQTSQNTARNTGYGSAVNHGYASTQGVNNNARPRRDENDIEYKMEGGREVLDMEFRGIIVRIVRALVGLKNHVTNLKCDENEDAVTQAIEYMDGTLEFLTDLMTTDRDKFGQPQYDFVAWVQVKDPNRAVAVDESNDFTNAESELRSRKDAKLRSRFGLDSHAEHEVQHDNDYEIVLAPIEIGKFLGPELRRLTEAGISIVFASATITTSQDFSKFCYDLGLTLDEVDTRIVESPFDYAKNARMMYSSSFVDVNDSARMSKHIELLKPVIDATPGGVFILTTSYSSLKEAEHECTKHFLSSRQLYVQKTNESVKALMDAFRKDGKGILIGTTSFWEGVDVPGQALSLVIIDRLPFKVANDPVNKARMDYCDLTKGNSFYNIAVPEAIIKLRQGVGRLIRNEKDLGVLILLDPRLETKRYGQTFLSSLPPMTRVTSFQEIFDFFNKIRAQQA